MAIYSKVAGGFRTQYPLRLAYALTNHKTQGETLEKIVVGVGDIEKSLGSTFVQFSRFKKFTDFMVKPFSYDRLTKIDQSKLLKARENEELRLKKKIIIQFLAILVIIFLFLEKRY